jgi:hypothetical protein
VAGFYDEGFLKKQANLVITLATKTVPWSGLFYITTLNLRDDVNCARVMMFVLACVMFCRERHGVNRVRAKIFQLACVSRSVASVAKD